MVVNKIISHLIEVGFSEYEAKVYASLVKTNPATAYEIAKNSGIPTSKIYEVISKLQEKKISSSVIILHYYKLGLCLPYPDFVLQKAII